jgi:transposase InsO family protein
MVGPAAKREAVAHLQTVMGLSERRACSFVGADRKMVRYRSSRPPETELRKRLRDLANERRRFGYRRLFILLRREGEASGVNRIYRLYREEGLTVRKRRTATSGRHTGADPGRGEAERALVAGLRARPVRLRPTLPRAQHRR